MNRADIWMPLYIGDYLADTARLTTEQHGAYLLLIMDYWRNGPPPDDDEILQSITRFSKFLWKKHRPILENYFQVQDGVWRHKRVDEEMLEALSSKEAASEKASKAASARWGKKDAPSITQALLEECPSPSPSPSLKKPSLSGVPDGAIEVLEYLNLKTGSHYRPVASNLGLIRGRLKEGATIEECKSVVDAKSAQWGNDAKMAEYLRPATLFGASNFAQYIGQLDLDSGPSNQFSDAL